MTPRPYRLGKRQEVVDETRLRIVEAARKLLKGDAYASFTVETVAREADVSRATVYYQFGSKSGLLEALFDDMALRGRMTDLAEAFQEAEPLVALDRFIETLTRFYASDRTLLRRLRGLAALDSTFAKGIRGRDERRRKGLAVLIDRITERHGRTDEDGLERALDVLHTLTSFETFDHLSRRGRRPAEVGKIIAELAREELGLAPHDPFPRQDGPAADLTVVRPAGLTEDEVARRANTSRDRVRQLVDLGILAPQPGSGEPFRGGDALRVQLVEELESYGIPAARVASAIAGGTLSLAYLDAFPAPPPRSARTHAELCDELGISFPLLDRIYAGFGLARPRPDQRVREEDLDIICGLPVLLASGLSEAEVLRAARVWGEGMRRVAQHQVHSFHELIEEPFRRQGLSDDQALGAALSRVGVRLIPYVTQLVGWLYRRHFEGYQTEHRLSHIESALEIAGLHRKPPAHPPACAFADLSGYTRLTEELGDAAAAEMALRLAELMQSVATGHRGLVVKMLGDGVHFHFREASDAVLGSLDLVERSKPSGLPSARVGINAGPMTYIDGDYYGLTVIIAARIAALAGPGEVLVGEAVTANLRPEGVRFEDIGPVPLKGVARPVAIFRAVREGDRPGNMREDPRTPMSRHRSPQGGAG